MEIKTVCKKISAEGTAIFDFEVNELLSDGWRLAKLDVIPGYDLGSGIYFVPSHYAELVKLEDADMEPQEDELPAWDDAVDALRFTCGTSESCSDDGCPMWAWCQKNLEENNPPANWDDPEKLDQPE